MSTATNGHVRRFTSSFPCPICKGHNDAPRGQGERCWGFQSGEFAHCTREEFAGQCRYHPESETYAHRLRGKCPCGEEHGQAEPQQAKWEIVATYDYHDRDGALLFQAVRYRPKNFRQRRPDGKGGWIANLTGITPVLYRLPEWLADDPTQWAFIVEGEKDVDRLRKFGLSATCNPMGAGKWRASYAKDCRGRRIVIIPDNDDTGRKHAQTVAKGLRGVAAEVKILDLAGLPEKGDVSDWLDRGGTIAELRRLADEAPAWSPPEPEPAEPSNGAGHHGGNGDGNGPGGPCPGDGRLPAIVCGFEDPDDGLKKWTPKALEALARANEPTPAVYQRGGVLVRVKLPAIDEPPIVERLAADSLRGVLDRCAYWADMVVTKKGPQPRWGPPRTDVVRDILSLGDYDPDAFPYLDLVVESPRFLPDGRLLLTPGYQAEGRLFYAPPAELLGLEVPERPTDEDLDWATGLLVEDLLYDFPFANDASRANAIGCMLLPFVRLMIAGPTPNHHFTASTEGTGKGLCAAACAFPALGRELDLNPQKESEAEWRKALTSAFLAGASHYLIDNLINPPGWDDVPLPIDSGTLAMAWTVRYYRDRILGGNQEARVKVQTVFMSSGNNTMFSRELNRRIVRIELMTPCEDPSSRTGFKHDPLMDWARERRRDLVQACLTLCQNWIAAGRPEGRAVMGSYECYARVIGGILDCAAIGGFLANRKRAVRRDPESERWVPLVRAWHDAYPTKPTSTAEIWDLIGRQEGLAERFNELLGDGSPANQKTRLGKALERHEGRVWGDWRIVRSTLLTANKCVLWKLQAPIIPVAEEGDEEGQDDGNRDEWGDF